MGFTLGAPRSFRLSPDGETVIFLRSRGGTDPVTCLWALDVATGDERLIADPAALGKAGAEDDPVEKARRERARERAGGIVAFATDAACTVAAFTLAGAVYLADLRPADNAADNAAGSAAGSAADGSVRELSTLTPAADPRPDPTGTHVAYVSEGALRVHEIATGADRALADPGGADGISFGLAEFIAAEEMDRSRGYWWAPDGSAILTARVDETPVQFWHIADPANPATEARPVRYPAAGTPNAVVSVFVATLAADLTEVSWDSAALPYLVTASWDASTGHPLLVVASRDQRDMRILAVDPATGATSLVRADTDPSWIDIVTGCAGQPGWRPDRLDRRHRRGQAHPCWYRSRARRGHGRGPHSRLDQRPGGHRHRRRHDPVHRLRRGSRQSISVWSDGSGGLQRMSAADGVHGGQQAAGTLLLASRTLADPGASVRVLRAGPGDGTAGRGREHRLAGGDAAPASAAAAPYLVGRAEPGQDRDRAAVLAHAGLGQAAGAVRPVRRSARAAGDGRRRACSSARSGSLSRASPSSSQTAAARQAADRHGTGRWPVTWPGLSWLTRSRRCTRPPSNAPTWT